MKKIFISSFNEEKNIHFSNTLNEKSICRTISNHVNDLLLNYGLDSKQSLHSIYLQDKIYASNLWKSDLYLSINLSKLADNSNIPQNNKCNVKFKLYSTSFTDKEVSNFIKKELINVALTENENPEDIKILYELFATDMESIYLDIQLNETKEDIIWLKNNLNNISNAIVNGICKAYGLII